MEKSEEARVEAIVARAEDMQRKWQDAAIRLEFAKTQFEHAKLCYELAIKVLEAKHGEPLADIFMPFLGSGSSSIASIGAAMGPLGLINFGGGSAPATIEQAKQWLGIRRMEASGRAPWFWELKRAIPCP